MLYRFELNNHFIFNKYINKKLSNKGDGNFVVSSGNNEKIK